MTKFWRDGFWRTSVNGNTHWVEGHSVERDDWERAATGRKTDYLQYVRAHVGTTSREVVPNAECPVCGQPVFFYQNARGSRVFFDELGPPWPKHPCTAYEIYPSTTPDTPVALRQENLRSLDEVEFIEIWGRKDSESVFENRYGTGRWEIAIFVTSYLGDNFSAVVLETFHGHRYFISMEPGPSGMRPGQLVTFYRNWISYLDTNSLEPVDEQYRRVRGKEVLHRILGIFA